jgi:hypothetical protein
MNKINITSSAVEKGIDLAKNFLDKLIIPAVEETGLLLKDKVTFWKFKNQVKMLNKAKELCEKNNISPKTISLKLLCPLLDYSALEEDEKLQDKWAILLSNMVDSDQNIENHVFPYILSQISLNEYDFLSNVYNDKEIRQSRFSKELKLFQKDKPELLSKLENQINGLEEQIEEKKKQGLPRYTSSLWELEKLKTKLKREVKAIERKENLLRYKIKEPESITEGLLKEFELSNLIRLGLIKFIQLPFANSQTLEIPYDKDDEYFSGYLTVDLDIDVETDEEYVLTELGDFFIKACTLKD